MEVKAHKQELEQWQDAIANVETPRQGWALLAAILEAIEKHIQNLPGVVVFLLRILIPLSKLKAGVTAAKELVAKMQHFSVLAVLILLASCSHERLEIYPCPGGNGMKLTWYRGSVGVYNLYLDDMTEAEAIRMADSILTRMERVYGPVRPRWPKAYPVLTYDVIDSTYCLFYLDGSEIHSKDINFLIDHITAR